MVDERPEDDERGRRATRDPRAAGQPSPEEVGSTAGRTHDQVLDATLTKETAELAKLRRDRSGIR